MSRSAPRRVYLAAGPELVAAVARGAELPAATPAFAVTAGARAAEPGLDEEDLEYDALRAAEDHLRAAGLLPVVVSADVPGAHVTETADGTGTDARVQLTDAVPARAVVCAHAPEPGAAEDEELLWYDVTELPALAQRLRD